MSPCNTWIKSIIIILVRISLVPHQLNIHQSNSRPTCWPQASPKLDCSSCPDPKNKHHQNGYTCNRDKLCFNGFKSYFRIFSTLVFVNKGIFRTLYPIWFVAHIIPWLDDFRLIVTGSQSLDTVCIIEINMYRISYHKSQSDMNEIWGLDCTWSIETDPCSHW